MFDEQDNFLNTKEHRAATDNADDRASCDFNAFDTANSIDENQRDGRQHGASFDGQPNPLRSSIQSRRGGRLERFARNQSADGRRVHERKLSRRIATERP